MLKALIKLSRPANMAKNLFVLAPVFFSGHMFHPACIEGPAITFLAFCLLTAGTYAVNDVADAEADLMHPAKRNRPIPSGRLTSGQALIFAALTAGAGAILTASLELKLLLPYSAYIALQLLYSLWLKDVPLLDLICISLGFILRIVAGGMAANIPVSPWLIAAAGALAFYMGAGKRLTELNSAANPGAHRRVLYYCGTACMEKILLFSGTATSFIYIAYVVMSDTSAADRSIMAWSIPPVILGLIRFRFLVSAGRNNREFVNFILGDSILDLLLLGWCCIFLAAIYL